jgi:hypothetical protein
MRSVFFIVALCGVLLLSASAPAQSFSLDDNPSAPLTGPLGPIPGFGAENPLGSAPVPPWFPPGVAPSPTLGVLACWDADMLSPGPVTQVIFIGPSYIGAVSDNTQDLGVNMRLRFSVDRLSTGGPGTVVSVQAGRNQQPGDIYLSTDYYVRPGAFVAATGPPGYGGVLPSVVPGGPSLNTLVYDDSVFGLLCGGGVVPASAVAPPIGFGTHDNVDAFDRQILSNNGDGLTDGWMYHTLSPDDAVWVGPGVSPAHVYDVAPNQMSTNPLFPFAAAFTMGLDLNGLGTDTIDALVVYDNHIQGGPVWGGPGAEPGIDYALFSLAPSSFSLSFYQLDAADVFYTNFTGTFWLYAPSATLGLVGVPGGYPPGGGDNVDALDPAQQPCPWDCDMAAGYTDGVVGITDFLALLGQWGAVGTMCDFDGGGVGITDFLLLLGAWGPCP